MRIVYIDYNSLTNQYFFYRSPIDKENFRRAEIGELRSNKDIIKNMAHEVAHLKFFKHTPQHHSYTKHILEKINNRLGGTTKNG